MTSYVNHMKMVRIDIKNPMRNPDNKLCQTGIYEPPDPPAFRSSRSWMPAYAMPMTAPTTLVKTITTKPARIRSPTTFVMVCCSNGTGACAAAGAAWLPCAACDIYRFFVVLFLLLLLLSLKMPLKRYQVCALMNKQHWRASISKLQGRDPVTLLIPFEFFFTFFLRRKGKRLTGAHK